MSKTQFTKAKKQETTKTQPAAILAGDEAIGKSDSANLFKYVLALIAVACLVCNFGCCMVGIHNYLLEIHSFRQTQTAITTYYFIKDGFKLAYETPILGAPWSIPFEFPAYQGIVAVVKKLLPFCTLDITGRFVSLAFFYLSVFYVYKIVKHYTSDAIYSLFALSFILLHPTYIYWSRAFLIESTVLFFCLFFIYYSLAHFKTGKYTYLALAVAGAILAGLVKVTTFVPFMFLLFIIIVIRWYKEEGYRFNRKTTLRYALYGLLLFAIPLLIAQQWVDFTDHLKSLNKLANSFISSAALNKWNYGTIDQKFSVLCWKVILYQARISNSTFYYISLAALAWVVAKKYKYWVQALVCSVLYFVGPVIFTNLYFIHEYYSYANSIFLCAAVAFIVLSLIKTGNIAFRLVGMLFALGTLTFFIYQYQSHYYDMQASEPDYLIESTKFVNQHTKPDDVVMVYGNDWGSEYAYYMERKTISLRSTFKSVKDTAFVNILEQNKQYKVNTLLLVFTNEETMDRAFANELIDFMGLKRIYSKSPFYIYQR